MINNLIQMDQSLFEELVVGREETQVKMEQTWLILFHSPVCVRCHEVLDVFVDLTN